jgi:hypothetical protein
MATKVSGHHQIVWIVINQKHSVTIPHV